MAQMKLGMLMDTTNKAIRVSYTWMYRWLPPEELYGSMHVEQTTIQKSQQVSLYKLWNFLIFAPPKFRQTVVQKTLF